MTVLFDRPDRPVESVLHPTDLSEASLTAFHHALALGIRYGARMTLLHAIGRRATDSWPAFPSARDTLARWHAEGGAGSLGERIKQSTISKKEVQIRDPVAACLRHIGRNAVDLVVLATEGRSGLSRLVRPSRAEKLARESRLPTLFVPSGARPFVDGETGAVTLRRIVVPVSRETDAKPAMLLAVRAAALLDDPDLEITLVHIGEGADDAALDLPALPYCRWNLVHRGGAVVEGILTVAEEVDADAVFMTTSWNRPSLVGTDRGVTEAVLSSVGCPVAAVPVEAR